MATMMQAPDGALPVGAGPAPQGPLLTIHELAALQIAPRRPAGTEVTVRAKPVFPWLPHFDLPGGREFRGPDHMYVEYDDGQRQLIARGGPSHPDLLGFAVGEIDGSNRMSAGVYPAAQSSDYGQGRRVVARRFLPGVTAEQAAAPARLHAQGVDRGGNGYGPYMNSNSFAADVGEPIFGLRVGDGETPGYRTHLRDDVSPIDRALRRQAP